MFAGTLGGSRIENVVRWTFVTGFVASVGVTLTVVLTGAVAVLLEVALITISAAVLLIGGTLLSKVFRTAPRAVPRTHPTA
jgi:hypothetical protein